MILPRGKISLQKIRAVLKTFYWFYPTNYTREKEKFLDSRTYNPKLLYPNLPFNKLSNYLETIEKMKIPEATDVASIIKSRKIEETKIKLKLILARGTVDITKFSAKLYQLKFDKKTLSSALEDSAISDNFNSRESLSVKQVAKQFLKYLSTYQKTNWKIIQSKRNDFYFQVRCKKNLISIGNNINWDYCDLETTFAHEIDGHVVRFINAQKQVNPLFQNNLPFYIKTEEGLACFLGDYLSKNGELSRKHHALKYLAGFIALNHSFRETYNFLKDNGFSCDLAFQRTLRLKRGFTDTSIPGCNAREAMYYEGMMEVKNYLEDGGNIRKLYAGKVGLQDLDYIPTPKNLIIPDRLSAYDHKPIASEKFVNHYL